MSSDLDKTRRAAEKYLAANKLPAAIREYCRIVETDHKDYNTLNTLGDLYARVNQKDDAVKCFARVAEHYNSQGFTNKAIAMYKKIVRIHPDAIDVIAKLAPLYQMLGLVAEARAHYTTVAEAYQKKDNRLGALGIWSRIADLDPNDVQTRLKLAESYLKEGEEERAIEAFNEAGSRLLAKKSLEAAAAAFAQVLRLRPFDLTALGGATGASLALGLPEDAAERLEAALKKEFDNAELWSLLAQSYIEAGDAAQAERATVKLVEREPSSYPRFLEIVNLYLKENNADAAMQTLERCGEMLLSDGHEEELQAVLNEILARNPEHLAALKLLARLNAWQRDDDALKNSLERLAESAQLNNNADVELYALLELVNLFPEDSGYTTRLRELQGYESEAEAVEESSNTFVQEAVPTFEHSAPVSDEYQVAASEVSRQTFDNEFVHTAEDSTASSFETNGFEIAGYDFSNTSAAAFENNSSDFSNRAEEQSALSNNQLSADVSAHLQQELEGVDFYLGQGYADLALESLNLLEHQFGARPEILERRQQIRLALGETEPANLSNHDAQAAASFEQTGDTLTAETQFVEATETEFQVNGWSDVSIYNGNGTNGFHSESETATVQIPSYNSNGNGKSNGSGNSATFEFAAPAVSVEENQAAENKVAPAFVPAVVEPQIVAPIATVAENVNESFSDMFDELGEDLPVGDWSDPQTSDYETHYNLGLAYKDMGLWNDAVEEFQTAVKMVEAGDGTDRYLQCCNLLGHCFMEKGMPKLAVTWFKRGLDAPGHTDDEYYALRYELGAAFEQSGDQERAAEMFAEVYSYDVTYRDVGEKLRELQTAVG